MSCIIAHRYGLDLAAVEKKKKSPENWQEIKTLSILPFFHACYLLKKPGNLWNFHILSLADHIVLVSSFFSLFLFFFYFFFVFYLFRATPAAYEDSQARHLIGAVADGLCHSHSNARSEPRLPPTPQLTRSLTHWARPGIEPATSWFLAGFISTVPGRELLSWCLKLFLFFIFLAI